MRTSIVYSETWWGVVDTFSLRASFWLSDALHPCLLCAREGTGLFLRERELACCRVFPTTRLFCAALGCTLPSCSMSTSLNTLAAPQRVRCCSAFRQRGRPCSVVAAAAPGALADARPHVVVVGAGWGGWCEFVSLLWYSLRSIFVSRGAAKALCEAGVRVTLLDAGRDATGVWCKHVQLRILS